MLNSIANNTNKMSPIFLVFLALTICREVFCHQGTNQADIVIQCPYGSAGSYDVQKNDCLFQLAKTFRTTVSDFLDSNRGLIDDENWILVGWTICLPENAIVPNYMPRPRKCEQQYSVARQPRPQVVYAPAKPNNYGQVQNVQDAEGLNDQYQDLQPQQPQINVVKVSKPVNINWRVSVQSKPADDQLVSAAASASANSQADNSGAYQQQQPVRQSFSVQQNPGNQQMQSGQYYSLQQTREEQKLSGQSFSVGNQGQPSQSGQVYSLQQNRLNLNAQMLSGVGSQSVSTFSQPGLDSTRQNVAYSNVYPVYSSNSAPAYVKSGYR